MLDTDLEVSVVIPCLNEAETVGDCVTEALQALRANDLRGEVVVADNGSTDASRSVAAARGARVVPVTEKGYGSALMGGIIAARGTYVIMGDADGSYDFGDTPRFVEKLREGADLVQGCRLPRGGGKILPGAMPVLHRVWGNPMFSWMVRSWFRAPIHDVHCGLRGFSRQSWFALEQRCTGMEFASEMVIRSALAGQRIVEVPTTLRPDRRRTGRPHLRTFRDGWRHLRFYLLFSPRRLFLYPGLACIALGLLGYAIAMPRVQIGRVTFDVHTLLFASLAIISGVQAIGFALFTKVFAIHEGLLPDDRRIRRMAATVTLERGLVTGSVLFLFGLALLAVAVLQWEAVHFGDLNYARTMRWVIPGMTLTVVGLQIVLGSFFLSILGLHRRSAPVQVPPVARAPTSMQIA